MNQPNFVLRLTFILLLFWQGSASSKILVISPHPDDDILISAGVTYAATHRGEQVTVVYMTNGDYGGAATGNLRQDEAVDAQVNNLGTRESDLIFLGYPDGGLDPMYSSYPNESDRYLAAPSGETITYGHRGLGATDYHNFRFGSHANYNRFNLLKDLKDIIDIQRPEHIITVTESGQHPDHQATYKATRDAVLAVSAVDPSYIPVLNTMLVWSTNSSIWPENANPSNYFNESPGLSGTGLDWINRESLDVPLVMQTLGITNPKQQAISAHASQGGTSGFIGRFLHKDEFFWPVVLTGANFPPRVNAGMDQTVAQGATVQLNGSSSSDPNGSALVYQWKQISGPTVVLANAATAQPSFTAPAGTPSDITLVFQLIVTDGLFDTLPDHVSVRALSTTYPNIASLATVTASSQNYDTNQQAIKAIDGVADGYPGDYTREWATVGEGAGAWIQLNWGFSAEVIRIVLHDRPNSDDMIASARLTFSNGVSINVGALDNAGEGVEFNVGPYITNSLRISITSVSGTTQNIGLSEIEVYGTPPAGGNLAPIANAGPDKTVAQGLLINLDGTGSSDPNGDRLVSYRWIQTTGPTVTLTDANTATPSFVTPIGLTASATLTFALTVNDGQVDSAPDSVDVKVTVSSGSGTNIASLATVTASSQNFNTNQQAFKAVDGVADGYPGDYTREWATIQGIAGSWIDLNWSNFYWVDHVILYDRPNTADQITSATLTFSDGSRVNVGALDNTGTGVLVSFPRVLTRRVTVTATSVSASTLNVGLAELEVHGISSQQVVPFATITPASLTFTDQTINTTSPVQTVTLSNTGNGPLSISSITATGPFPITQTCGISLAAGTSCLINVSFAPVVAGLASGALIITDNSNGMAGSTQTVTLSGTRLAVLSAPSIPTVIRDNFNLSNAVNLGANWQQTGTNGSVLRVNSNQAYANLNSATGYAYHNTAAGAIQAAGFTFSNTSVNNTALFLKATGALGANSGQLQNAIRVLYNAGSVRVATTTNSNAGTPTYTNVGSSISTGGNLVNGNSLLAAVDNAGKVWIWKRVGATTTLLTSAGVQLPKLTLWTTSGGKVGLRLPNRARVDNFVAY